MTTIPRGAKPAFLIVKSSGSEHRRICSKHTELDAEIGALRVSNSQEKVLKMKTTRLQ